MHGLDSDTDDDEEAREHKANALRRVTSDKTNQQKRVATSGGGSGSGNGVPAGLPAERSRKSSLPGGAVEGHGEEKKVGRLILLSIISISISISFFFFPSP